ncbi:hypothetical protein LEP1GSC202_2245 [Leptospira yanagawae serovar Saopaulo str. Sao Paulo = ATCC 700523]|uniref:Uncharacterized protein n=1 Tax=Leptospira yanagawae serovar Saopaulo str. Sao Paulo = ATCC 700523 TaxID=1249483 RepID=A0A5E8HCL5_9LEPT|nr:hypothetical protein LEP1GSC202_2245 [Leptospira yanagawae serovar Saopaulo str. Sao Paulo = ATCC 700523]
MLRKDNLEIKLIYLLRIHMYFSSIFASISDLGIDFEI